MLARWLHRQHVQHGRTVRLCVSREAKRGFGVSGRYAANAAQDSNPLVAKTRNIGIIAHIDAGKTTTTERMLYYGGFTRRLGDVDEGSTVTDFLPAERARGITIQSAAISFSWPPEDSKPPATPGPHPRSATPHNINLIDTPGHADFTFEVLRSLRVLDGAVCILDSVAGVEAQTEKVWAQASNYAIPRIIYVNKLDRDGAAFARTVKEIGARLEVWPAVCGIPWWTAEGKLCGVADVVNLRGLKWSEGGDGREIQTFDLAQLQNADGKFATELQRARVALVELLSEHDDQMVEKYLEVDEDHLAISGLDITESLRRSILHHPQSIVPVLAGSSLRNVGVQPLLDAVDDLLPSPEERPDPEVSAANTSKGGLSEFLTGKLSAPAQSTAKNNKSLSKDKSNLAIQNIDACALAFKVVADARRGVLVYVRVYSGTLKRNAPLWNTSLQTTERAQRLLKMYASDAVEIEAIPAGQIGVIPGLKAARTGDTLISYAGVNPKTGPPAPINTLQLRPIDVPPPVFFVSVEPNSLAEEKHIKEALDLLLREDPSLHVSVDEESGQTHLSGMGELHLEIARDRLVQDLKAKARISSIEIGYREALTEASDEVEETFEREVAGKSSKAGCCISVEPRSDDDNSIEAARHGAQHVVNLPDNNTLLISTPMLSASGQPTDPSTPALPTTLPLQSLTQALTTGVSAALARGPTHGYPLHSTTVRLTFHPTTHLHPTTTPAALSSAARRALLSATRRAGPTALMEPVMRVAIAVDAPSLGAVVHDISSARGGSVLALSSDDSSDGPGSGAAIDPAKIYTPPDPFGGGGAADVAGGAGAGAATRQITARVPLKEMVGYLKHLRALTAGRGTFTMAVDRFERMAKQRERAVLAGMRGDWVG